MLVVPVSAPPHPFGTAAAKQPSHEACAEIHGLQHLSHTLQPAMTAPQATVLFSWPQLCCTMHLQVAMHSPGDSEPSGSRTHWPAVELQLYMTGVGAGVGTGVGFGVGTGVGGAALQVAMHSPGDSEPSGSSLHLPAVVSQLYMTGVGAGVGGAGVGFGGGFGVGVDDSH